MNPAIPTKLGQAPTDSPRTLESNRRRLGSLFSSLTIANAAPSTRATASSSTTSAHSGTPSRSNVKTGGWLSWLTPTKTVTKNHHGQESDWDDDDEDASDVEQEDEGCFVEGDSMERSVNIALGISGEGQEAGIECLLYRLPDELLIEVLLRLPPTLQDLCTLSLVSRRFRSLSQTSELWVDLLRSTPGFNLVTDPGTRIEIVNMPPRGRWQGDEWTAYPAGSTSPETSSIPVHYPTLYRSRLSLQRSIHSKNPSEPPHRAILRDHTDSVYCVHLASPWIITGSRDRTIRIWRLEDLPAMQEMDGRQETRLVYTVEKAHEGSVLSVRFEMNAPGDGGTLVTGSSDMTACVWEVRLEEEVKVEKIGTLRGHTGGVLDVALSKTRIATCSKDETIRIYKRSDFTPLFTLVEHIAPVNCLSVNPCPAADQEQMVSASGDGFWIVWDMVTGREVRRGGGTGRGLACVVWEGPYILTGDNDRLIKLYSAEDTKLIWIFDGHTDLVRSISVDLNTGIIVSGSYDQTVRMWDLRKGHLIRSMRGIHSSLVFGVATARGRIVTVSHDSTVQIRTYGPYLPYRNLFA